MKNPYRLFQPTYTEKVTGAKRQSDTYQIAFRDHLARRQTFTAEKGERDSHRIAGRLLDIVTARRNGSPLSATLRNWIDGLPAAQRKRLATLDLIDRQAEAADALLIEHLEGRTDADGELTEPGYRHALQARGVTAKHVEVTCKRVADCIAGAGFVIWRDMVAPGAAARVEHWLKGKRDKQEMSSVTANYYIRELRGFCKWMSEQGKAPSIALQAMKGIANAKAESEDRRELTVAEMRSLIESTANADERQKLTGPERALLYRFGFETGIRPNQIRSLTVGNFDLAAKPPTVTTQARHVKRRRVHTQVLRPALAADLAELFKTMMPTAPAIRMPKSEDHLADLLRFDLSRARREWINAAGEDDNERELRQRSDFLAEKDRLDRRAVFYSLRHGHGTALADAGVPEKDIAASMHHASRTTTERYLHAGRKAIGLAIDAMPDLTYSLPSVATGTAGAEPVQNAIGQVACAAACATAATPVESDGVQAAFTTTTAIAANTSKQGVSAILGQKPIAGLMAELADAVDSKSTA